MIKANTKTTISSYTLELTPEQLAALYIILGNVAADPKKSLRGHSDAIWNSIEDLLRAHNKSMHYFHSGFTGQTFDLEDVSRDTMNKLYDVFKYLDAAN